MEKYQEFWFVHLVQILLNYLIIIIPTGLFVYLVKQTDVVPVDVKQWRIIRLFVYGIPEDPLQEVQLPLVKSDHDDLMEKDIEKKKYEKKEKSWFNLIFCVCGLQISFLTWGILQEKIMTQTYELSKRFFENDQISENLISIVSTFDENSETVLVKFQNAQFLVLINRILAFILAVIVLTIRSSSDGLFCSSRPQPQPPFYQYMYCSISNILSSWCQYEALKYVSFPVQVLSKGFKMIPTMLMNSVMMGRGQKREEWIFAVAISIGMTIFLLNEKPSTGAHPILTEEQLMPTASFLSGFFILSLYLTLDAFTSNWQQSLFDKYPRTLTSIHMMAAVNFYSILFTLSSLAQQSDLWPAIHLVMVNPVLLRDCIILSICSASGQLFIFYTISTFGAIIFSLIMTLRQALAILLSCIIYQHSMSLTGFFGVLIIFGSLFTKSFLKYQEKRKKKKSPPMLANPV